MSAGDRLKHIFGSSHEELLDRLACLVEARDRLDSELAVVVAEVESAGAWAASGCLSVRQHLRVHARRSRDEVTSMLGLARLVRSFSATADALGRGTLPVPFARLLAGVVTAGRSAFYQRDESVLLGYARTLSLRSFEEVVRHWVALVDQELPLSAQHPDQRLVIQGRLDGGADLCGQLDAPTAQVVLAGIDRFIDPPDPLDGPVPARSRARRQADALGDLATAALAAGSLDGAEPPGGPLGSTTVLIDLASLEQAHTAGSLAGAVAARDGRPLSASAVEQLACRSWISAVVVDQRGAVVDATERSAPFTATQRRALAARDRGCAFPGCDRPPSWCDAHHLQPRSSGGTNTLDNGVLLCRRHHQLVHSGWTMVRSRRAWHATSPSGRVWSEQPAPCDPDPPPDFGSTAA